MNHMLRNSTGQLIDSIDAWPRPKREYQWQPGRSAMELARSWFRTGALACPEELTALLQSHDLTRGCELLDGQPEFVTPLPEFGEGRNHDLWLRAASPAGPVTICIEAKADEPFGACVADEIQQAMQRSPNTRLPARIEALLELLFGRRCNPLDAPWRDIRYQLITALAGTAIQAAADGASTAVLVVQQFCGPHLKKALQTQNDADLNAFVRVLLPGLDRLEAGRLVGPITVRAGRRLSRDVNLLVGKIQCQIDVAGS